MAQGATVYNFDITLADVDRGVYETLALRVAQHPTETLEYMCTRVLAYCLEYQEGIAFGQSIGTDGGDQAAVWARDASGNLSLWVEIGMPDFGKVHRASKGATRVAIYTHRDPFNLMANLRDKGIYDAEQIPIYSFDRGFISQLAAAIGRRTRMDVSITERQLYVSVGEVHLHSPIIEEHIT